MKRVERALPDPSSELAIKKVKKKNFKNINHYCKDAVKIVSYMQIEVIDNKAGTKSK